MATAIPIPDARTASQIAEHGAAEIRATCDDARIVSAPMRASSCLAVLAVAAAPLAAQNLAMTCRTASPVGSLASAAGAAELDSRSAGRPIGAWPEGLSLHAARSASLEYASASTNVYVAPGATSVVVQQRCFARGAPGNLASTSASETPASLAAPGPISFAIEVLAGTPRPGVLAVGWSAFADPHASIIATVDVGADGSIDWTSTVGPDLWTAPVWIGATPLPLLVTLDARASGTGDAQRFVDSVGDLTIGCLADSPSTCVSSAFGASCAPSLFAAIRSTPEWHEMTMTLVGGPPDATVISIVGERPVAQMLPGGCSLWTTPRAVRVVATNSTGTAVDIHRVPSTAVGSVYMQMLPFVVQSGAVVLTASNGVQVRCAR